MTRLAPTQVIACPHCQHLALRKRVSSFCSYGFPSWSDGYVDSFASYLSSPSFTRCSSCNGVFWLEDATVVGTLPDYRDERLPSAWQRFLNRLRGKAPNGDRQKIPEEWQCVRPVERPDLDAFIVGVENLSEDETPEREQRLRRRLWWRFNDPDRREGQTAPGISATIRETHERSNLLRLLELSRKGDSPVTFEHVEILRELGRFDEAREALASLNPETVGVAVLAAKIEARDAKVCITVQETW